MAGDGESDSESGRSYERDKKSGRFCKKGSEGALKGKFPKKIPAAHASGVGTRVGEKRPATRAGRVGTRIGKKRPAMRTGGEDSRSARWIRVRRVAGRVSSSDGEDCGAARVEDKQEGVSDIDSGGDEVKAAVGRRMRRAPADDNGGEGTSRWMCSDTSSDSDSGSDTSSEEGTCSCSICSEEERSKQKGKKKKVLIDLISSSEDEKGKEPERSKPQQKKQQKGKKASFNEHVQKIWTLNRDIRTTEVEILGLVDQISKAHAKKMELQHALEKEQRKPIKNFRVEV